MNVLLAHPRIPAAAMNVQGATELVADGRPEPGSQPPTAASRSRRRRAGTRAVDPVAATVSRSPRRA